MLSQVASGGAWGRCDSVCGDQHSEGPQGLTAGQSTTHPEWSVPRPQHHSAEWIRLHWAQRPNQVHWTCHSLCFTALWVLIKAQIQWLYHFPSLSLGITYILSQSCSFARTLIEGARSLMQNIIFCNLVLAEEESYPILVSITVQLTFNNTFDQIMHWACSSRICCLLYRMYFKHTIQNAVIFQIMVEYSVYCM